MSDPVWTECRVRDLIEKHFCGPSPDCEERNLFSDEEWGVLKTTAITWAGWDETAHKVLPMAFWNQPDLEVRSGDVLVTKAGPRHRVGVVCHVSSTRRQLIVSGKMIGLRPKVGLVESSVLAGLISQRRPQKYIQDRTTGMAESQVNFANDALLEAPLSVPPPPEQFQITKVLNSLDNAIEHTGAIVAKLRAVKQGLLHDLLTRGIDANGELRPPQSEAPQRYKQSPLGWIPKEWRDSPIRDVVAETVNGASIRTDEFSTSGVPVIAKGDVTTAKYIDTKRRIQFVASGLAASKYKASMINREFVVCSMRDLVPSAPTLGMASVLDDTIDGLLAQGATAIRLYDERYEAELLVEITRLPWFRKKMRSLAVGSTQVHMRGRDYFDVVVPVPLIEEQREIVKRIQSVDRSVALHQASATTLLATKCGLVEDLLTGRVRVTPLLEQADR